MPKSIDTTVAPKYDSLVTMLRDRFDDDLRWVAPFDTPTYNYTVHYIRPDLKTDLSPHDFDVVVHRSIALFRRPYVEEVYAHLGNVKSLVLEHDRAAGNDIVIPEFTDERLTALFSEEAVN
ncbi:hypothetical protein [Haloferax profundi]|uniref:Uncharacterized protein n=1 Tax=Haloferax profundi TaxID=1544718 RepID=A0A0W1RL54_9EURY|nr:hypothetical protein [Haloferax profundi]KTG14042.1 hypothetical protein AUR66_19220 [Haloferax profundi]